MDSRIFDIPVKITFHGDEFVVTDAMVNMYGSGLTENEAIKDYKTSIMAYFAELKVDKARLGDNLLRHLDYLMKKKIPKAV